MDNLKSRHIKEILYLLETETQVSLNELSQKTGIKVRTIKNDLDNISEIVSSEGFKLVRRPGIGISIYKDSSQDVDKFRKKLLHFLDYEYLEREERVKVIFCDCVLFEKAPTVEDWCFKLNVSRPSILKDINFLKHWLENRDVTMKGKPGIGYSLEGREENIRQSLLSFLFEKKEGGSILLSREILSRELNEQLGRDWLRTSEFFLHEVEKGAGIKLIESDFAILTLRLAISVVRIKKGNFVTLDPKKTVNVMQSFTYRVVVENLEYLENNYKVKFTPDEISYLALSFLSSKGGKVSLTLFSENSAEDKKYFDYAKEIVNFSSNALGIHLPYDFEFVKMLALHLKKSIMKITYGFTIDNPILKDIKEKYPLQFEIAKRALSLISKRVHLSFPEEEVGYIAMYLSVMFERFNMQGQGRKKVAIVCSLGLGTSDFLFWRLRNEMPELDIVEVDSAEDVLKNNLNGVDLIVSTTPLPQVNFPNIVVSPFLTSDERKAIREKLGILSSFSPNNVNFFNNVLDEGLMFPQISFNTSLEVIKFMSDALFEKGLVKEGFAESVIEREKNFPTGLNTVIPIAIPHTTSAFSKKEGFAIATLKEPIDFKDMGNPKQTLKVKIVLIPVLMDNGPFTAFFSELIEKLRDTKVVRKLIFSETPQEMKRALIQTSLF